MLSNALKVNVFMPIAATTLLQTCWKTQQPNLKQKASDDAFCIQTERLSVHGQTSSETMACDQGWISDQVRSHRFQTHVAEKIGCSVQISFTNKSIDARVSLPRERHKGAAHLAQTIMWQTHLFVLVSGRATYHQKLLRMRERRLALHI